MASGHMGEGTCMVKQGGFGHLDHKRLGWQYGSSLGLDSWVLNRAQ